MLRPYRELGPPSIMLKRSTCNSESSWMGSQRVSMSQTGGSEAKSVWVLNPHVGLWGTLPDSHIVGPYILPVG